MKYIVTFTTHDGRIFVLTKGNGHVQFAHDEHRWAIFDTANEADVLGYRFPPSPNGLKREIIPYIPNHP
jgi:hypothetical protein